MPDNPFFPVELIPIAHVGLPGHTGGFKHPDNQFRICLSSDDNLILGILDKQEGFITNEAINDIVIQQFPNTLPDHQIYFSGRETELRYTFPVIQQIINDTTFTYSVRIRNSYDLSINNYITSGLIINNPNLELVGDRHYSAFLPCHPIQETKLSKYSKIPFSTIRNYRRTAREQFDRSIEYYQAMMIMPATASTLNTMATTTNINAWSIRPRINNMGNSLFAHYAVVQYYLINLRSSGKSSPASLYQRRLTKLNKYMETFDEAINEVINHNRQLDAGNATYGDDAPLHGGIAVDPIHTYPPNQGTT